MSGSSDGDNIYPVSGKKSDSGSHSDSAVTFIIKLPS
jgi:hypothetical protein